MLLSESFPVTPQFQSAAVLDTPQKSSFSQPSPKVMPKDRISEQEIKVYPDSVVIEAPHAVWATFADTGSMEPLLFQGANALQMKPSKQDDIQVGDIISYKPFFLNDTILIHRVVAIEGTGENWRAYAQGDANPFQDPEPITFDQIERVTFAVVY